MEHGRRGRRRLGWCWLRGPHAQATTEYLLVLSAFLAAIAALALLWHAARDGGLVTLATDAASHGAGDGIVPLLKDVLGY